MGDADHDGDAPVDEFDGPADQRLALLETEICIFLSLDACCDDHGCAAVPHNIVDLTLQSRLVQLEIGRKRRQRRDDQSWLIHSNPPSCCSDNWYSPDNDSTMYETAFPNEAREYWHFSRSPGMQTRGAHLYQR